MRGSFPRKTVRNCFTSWAFVSACIIGNYDAIAMVCKASIIGNWSAINRTLRIALSELLPSKAIGLLSTELLALSELLPSKHFSVLRRDNHNGRANLISYTVNIFG